MQMHFQCLVCLHIGITCSTHRVFFLSIKGCWWRLTVLVWRLWLSQLYWLSMVVLGACVEQDLLRNTCSAWPLQRDQSSSLCKGQLLSLLFTWQNYWMLIGWEAYNYFINCTAVQLMILPKQNGGKQNGGKPLNEGNCPRGTLKAKGLMNKSTKF